MAKRTKSARKPKLGKRLTSDAGDEIMRITLHLPYELVRRSTLWGKEQAPTMDFDAIVIGALDAYVPMPSAVVVVKTPGQPDQVRVLDGLTTVPPHMPPPTIARERARDIERAVFRKKKT
jgi:hypothetical protein